ncbi:hypothetical protein Q8F55_006636 [Vanrija albida]|uniref:37S ribosomal protein mrp10, mitochondrial n=1 Tax=Vanrija albida TaxID=181172 RepID=A0ABR3PXP8_9TREE
MVFRYKVRPTKQIAEAPCSPELMTLLSCFATTGDLRAGQEGAQGCAQAARTLHACMAKPPRNRGKGQPSINFLLSKVR